MVRVIYTLNKDILEMNRKDIISYCKNNVLLGKYIIHICKNCGAYFTNPDSFTEDFKFVEQCKFCVNKEM